MCDLMVLEMVYCKLLNEFVNNKGIIYSVIVLPPKLNIWQITRLWSYLNAFVDIQTPLILKKKGVCVRSDLGL